MFTGKFDDKLSIFSESMIISMSMSLFIFYNISLAKSICEVTKIPYDLTLTQMSFGFGNNIIILLSFAQFILIVLFVEKFIPKLIDRIVWC